MKNAAQLGVRNGAYRAGVWLIPICYYVALPACAAPADRDATPSAQTEEISIRVSEGTSLMFDVARNSLVFDLLGQLWVLPESGGNARAVTNAVQDTAEDLDPSFSPDGQRVLFRADRGGRTGLWLLDLKTNQIRQLTQVSKATAYDGGGAWSPDGTVVAFARDLPPDSAGPPKSGIELLNVTSGVVHELRVDGLPRPGVRDPSWSPDGRRIAFVNTFGRAAGGARIWMVDATGGPATPITAENVQAVAPAFSPDGRRIAFLAPDTAKRVQVWVLDVSASASAAARQLTNHDDVVPGRVRWTSAGGGIVYAADGHLRKIAPTGGTSSEIPFTANLTFTRPRRELPAARFAEPGEQQTARGFLGLSLSPDAKRIAAIALGKLWIIPVGGPAGAITDMPFSARGAAWSPSGDEIAWSGGAWEQEDIFATNVTTGATRRVTALAGREASPSYSPDGRHLAFVHDQEQGTLRVIDANAPAPVNDTAQTRNLGAASVSWTRAADASPLWSPASDALLLTGDFNEGKPTTATVVPLSGVRRTITRFPDAPIFLTWIRNNITWLRHDRLWQAAFDSSGLRAEPQPLGGDPALYPSTANDGSVLYISEDGLRLRSSDGAERRLGWPIAFKAPVAPALLIKNVHVIDGTGAPATAPQDVLVERGRIARIAMGIAAPGATAIDGTGKFLMPGLMDMHAHVYRPDLLPGFLYFGITTVRDQGSSIGPLVAYADGIAAGVLPGPRVGYGGFQFYSDWPFDEEQGRGIEPEADPDHVKRSVALATAFGAQHIKTRTFRRWDINARMIEEAHRRGLRATGHCAHPLPLVAAGIDAKEHIGLCATRANGSLYSMNDVLIYDDQVQLSRAARIGVVPTIAYLSFAARMNAQPRMLDRDAELAPFIAKDSFGWMIEMKPEAREHNERAARQARLTTAKLARAGITIGTGTDIWQIPTGVHMEMEELVASGLSPAQAIRAATSGSARILGAEKDLGTIEVGKRADIVLLDADPLADIRHTRRIAAVIKDGRLVDRPSVVTSDNRD